MVLFLNKQQRNAFFTDYLTPHIEDLSPEEIESYKETITESNGYVSKRSDIPKDQYYVIVKDSQHSNWGPPKTLGLMNYMIFHTYCQTEAKNLIRFFRHGCDGYNEDIQYIQYRENIPFFDDSGAYNSNNYYSLFENDYEQSENFYRRAHEWAYGDEDESDE